MRHHAHEKDLGAMSAMDVCLMLGRDWLDLYTLIVIYICLDDMSHVSCMILASATVVPFMPVARCISSKTPLSRQFACWSHNRSVWH